MSGGFFRGTSADQDTRFSNKMSKLLKSQKFAPELDVLVEMAKVKIDVIKPWIATRVTELMGFEDEVLINFIYGLLDVKEADGKHLQIQLTGFMEKNTGRFMKELWGLLTSAQSNASGVPQQFLDAKAEEAKKMKDEKDRMMSEVLRRKEEQEKDAEERQRRLAVRDESSKAISEKRGSGSPGRGSDRKSSERVPSGRNGRRSWRRTPPNSSRRSPSRSSSSSRDSAPNGRRYRRSISRSPRRRRQSVSPYNRRRPPGQRYSPRPPARLSAYRRRSYDSRSPPSRRRSPRRSPKRLRSRSPVKTRRSPGAVHSPIPHRHTRSSPRLNSPGRIVSVSPGGESRSRSPYSRGKSSSRDRVTRRSRSPRRRRSREREPRFSGSPYKRRRSPSPYQRRRSRSRDIGGAHSRRSPHRSGLSPVRERGRRNGFDPRDRDRLVRDSDRQERRSERFDKRDGQEQRASPLTTERDSPAKEGIDARTSRRHTSGGNDLPRILEVRDDDVDTEAERSDPRRQTRADGNSSRPEAPSEIPLDIGKVTKGGERMDDLSDDDIQESSPIRAIKRAKDVSEARGDEDGSETPVSGDERRISKRRRKEEKRLRKEERRRRREEKHKRKEERRAARAARAAADIGENGDESPRRMVDKSSDGAVGVYRSKGDESEDEQKRTEKELRNKALESLRAKKGDVKMKQNQTDNTKGLVREIK